jgi:hypothetical protein
MTQEVLDSLKIVVEALALGDNNKLSTSNKASIMYEFIIATSGLDTLSRDEKTELHLFTSGLLPRMVQQDIARRKANQRPLFFRKRT